MLWRRGDARSKERGAVVVEFVLLFPILLGLALGVWEFGRIVDALLVTTNAAREGARYATTSFDLDDTPDDVRDKVRDRVMAYLEEGYGARLGDVDGESCTGGDVCLDDETDIDVEFFDEAGNGPDNLAINGEVRVTVRVTVAVFQTFVPGLADLTTLTGRASMRL